jgi:hypothetical protein
VVEATIYEVIDDSRLLAIVDPDAYETFVAEDWTFEQLEAHFVAQMAAKRLLVWDSGMPNIWEVAVSFAHTGARGFREVAGPVVSTQGRLLLTSNSLGMAAQYADVTLPEPHERDQVVMVPTGEYNCRIVQLHDPGLFADDRKGIGEPDFVIELIQSDDPLPVWTGIPWLRR